MFDLPAHGEWCHARTYPIICPHCGQRVYYFTCAHGSKVFFDELGWPWPKHRCIESLIEEYGPEFMGMAMEFQMKLPGGIPIGRESAFEPPSVKSSPSSSDKSQPPIIRCEPEQDQSENMVEELEDEGIVREILRVPDVPARLGILPESIAGYFLGQRDLLQDGIQVTVHARRDSYGDAALWLSYTFLVSPSIWREVSIKRGDIVRFVVRPLKQLQQRPLWICHRIKRILPK